MTKFTKGKWEYDDSQRYYSTRVIRRNGAIICNPVHQTHMSQEEYDANVRLLTNAPNLYKALLRMTNFLDSFPPSTDPNVATEELELIQAGRDVLMQVDG